MAEQPIACTLPATEFRARLGQLLPSLRKLAGTVERRENGIALRFDASTAVMEQLTRVIDAERQCCRFLRFRLTVEPEFGPILLEVIGPEGTAEVLAALIES